MYRVCDDERINRIYYDCISISGLKEAPVLYFGMLNEPACVVTFFHPVIILNEVIVKQLMEKELVIVLCHELTHIKRRHHIYQNIYNLINILHWFNLFAWISKNDFAEHCEIDCDQKSLSIMNCKVTEIEYATTMLHLMELSSSHCKHKVGGIEALGYLHAKQRMNVILNELTRVWRIICMVILVLFITLTLLYSVYVSRSYFYPYPAYDIASEYSAYRDAY
jgi:beta-lactamase regulating signal transducer with metallopeptidase domain